MSERRTKMKPPRRLGENVQTFDISKITSNSSALLNISDSSSSSSESTSSFSSDDEETDVRDLKPIKDYLNDRRQLAAQLFKSVKLEKIRRMLPQALKKMNLYDLEEWCGSELSGMSRRRILSIISGQRMTDSSDTDETEDSGPSLEIISDTEEWLTDDDVVIKEEDSVTGKPKSKKNADKVKGKARPVSKDKAKAKPNPKAATNSGKDNKSMDVNVKVEGQRPESKEGETLLDLLELEMRARAIRALIRKEEDIIPGKPTAGTSSEKNGATTSAIVNPAVSKYVVQEMQQISVALRQGSGLDDDVMLVIQPAPTIELLSSDSENENKEEKEKESDKQEESKRVNQKLESERDTGKEEKRERVNQRLEVERENDEEENKDTVENKESDEDNHTEQSKRVNKRLENERGTETTHSTSTIGDEVVEIPDEVRKEEESLAASEKNIAEPVIEEMENSMKSSEKNVDQVSVKLYKSLAENPMNTTAETSNKTPEKSSDETTNEASEKSPEKIPDKKNTDKKQKKQGKVPDEPEKAYEKGSNEPENESNEEKSPDKPKSPEKELEEGELTPDSEEEAPEVNVNIEKLKLNKRVKRRRHIRSKVHESSEESKDSDQSETAGSESEVSDKGVPKVKPKSRKKIRDRTRDVKATGSREKVNESTKDNAQDSRDKKEGDTLNEVERQKEELINRNVLKKKQEDAEKDMGEIIDLDDYPDDMDDLENNEKSKSGDLKKSDDKIAPETLAAQSEPAETWASRYYNTDDVQNVIKESKIHSEIRKRLRERQRIYKLMSPNPTAGSGSSNDIKVEEEKQKPLGSVEEYLALKAASAAAESAVNEKTEVLPEKSRKAGRKRETSHKSKSHTSKRRSKSDNKSAKDGSARKRKERDTTTENNEARPD